MGLWSFTLGREHSERRAAVYRTYSILYVLSCVTCCCYKLLENPTISHVKNKPTRDAIIHLLGVQVKKYNHLLGQ